MRAVPELNRRNAVLVKKYHGKIMPFEDLPRPAQRAALALHDEEGSDEPIEEMFFGYVEIPTEELKKLVVASDPIIRDNFGNFDDYHAWYMSQGDMPKHRKSVWPIILSPFGDEAIWDGWHRFHYYIERGLKRIPAIYFAKTTP